MNAPVTFRAPALASLYHPRPVAICTRPPISRRYTGQAYCVIPLDALPPAPVRLYSVRELFAGVAILGTLAGLAILGVLILCTPSH